MRRAAAAVAAVALAGCASGAPTRGGPPSAGMETGGTPQARHSSRLSPPALPGRAADEDCASGKDRPDLLSLGTGALSGVQFVSASHGWAVGLNRIVSTTDGGRHWNVQDRGRLGLVSVDFTDDWHGWAVGAGRVLATSDGGQHWRVLPEPCPAVRAVHFVSPSVGFAVAGGTQVGPFGGLLVPGHGGVVLATGNGGRTWRPVAAPAGVQSVCFNTAERGWLGAAGHLYRTADGGHSWDLAAAGPRSPRGTSWPYTMIVQCAGTDSVWGLDIGPGVAASQAPHVGYHATPATAVPLFAEGYFPHPGVAVHAPAPGSYPGPFSAVSASAAVYIDSCPACPAAAMVPWDLATGGGAVLRREGSVGDLTLPHAAAFLTPAVGWVTGTAIDFHHHHERERIVSTTDGGRTWRIDYTSR